MPALFGLLALLVFFVWFNPVEADTLKKSPVSELSFTHEAPLQKTTSATLRVKAASATAFEKKSGARLFAQAETTPRSIASLTKLMTALVFLDNNPGWNKEITVKKEDFRAGAKANLFPGDVLSIKDLFTTSLVASHNTAVNALVRSTGMSEAGFVKAMNEKARELRLSSTVFADPTGLAAENRSTAVALVKLAKVAFAKPEIVAALKQTNLEVPVSASVDRPVKTTNKLLGQQLPHNARLIAGKTGHLEEAGYCFAGLFTVDGREVVTVVLGAKEETERFSETTKLLDWTIKSYQWK